jgi:hypothetical protein
MLESRLMLAQTTGLFFNNAGSQDGYVLFSPNTTTTTYLMDKAGNIVNQWHSQYVPGLISYLLPNGNLLRDDSPHGQSGNGYINAAGAGGLLDEYDWNGNLVWQYAYDSPTHLAHHDFQVLPNGDILLVAWELKSQAEATAAGRNPALPGPGYLYPDSIVEIKPDIADGTGTIVWQWHVWDHLVQDFDPTKSNYYGPTGVEDHPELINLNYVSTANDGSGAPEDWTHCNGIDYNPQLDQIVLSSREFSEFWIIDHSTTTAQAASHSGGRSGHGGDLLYRYGNPQTYDRGTAADRVFYYQHDPKWIPAGSPGAGDITVFNNGIGRPGDQDYSSVDEITPPPVDANGNYLLTAGQPYGPSAPTWIYVAPPAYFSAIIGSATRLPNGNTLIDYGVDATFSEVTPTGQEVWKYVSPYTAGGTLGPTTPIPSLGLPPPILSSLDANFTFQAIYYPVGYITPRHVTNVVVDSTAWSPTYLSSLAASPLGNGAGYVIPVGSAAQLQALPWDNLNQIQITFSGPVNVQESSLMVTGLNVAQYAFSGFSYNALTYTATWTLAAPIGRDKVLLDLQSSGSAGVTDPAGKPLDGEWTNGASSFPSGDGAAGGDFNFAFNVLPGDTNQDGIVNGLDIAQISSHWLQVGGILGDTNGDNVVNGLDIVQVASHWLATLPAGGASEAAGASAASIANTPSPLESASVLGAAMSTGLGMSASSTLPYSAALLNLSAPAFSSAPTMERVATFIGPLNVTKVAATIDDLFSVGTGGQSHALARPGITSLAESKPGTSWRGTAGADGETESGAELWTSPIDDELLATLAARRQ